MGSLNSKPKAPALTYVPAPVVVASTPAPSVETPPAVNDVDSERASAIVRKRSLPETILTSFRGVLSQGDWVPRRKSLLGE